MEGTYITEIHITDHISPWTNTYILQIKLVYQKDQDLNSGEQSEVEEKISEAKGEVGVDFEGVDFRYGDQDKFEDLLSKGLEEIPIKQLTLEEQYKFNTLNELNDEIVP